MLDERRIEHIADDVLGRVLGGVGFAGTRVEARPDHDGEDALYVRVAFRPGAPVTSGRASADAMVSLMDELRSAGEHRFPYLIYDYEDDERPFEEAGAGEE